MKNLSKGTWTRTAKGRYLEVNTIDMVDEFVLNVGVVSALVTNELRFFGTWRKLFIIS